MNIPQRLIDKYNVPVPRYTSYPPANFFNDNFGSEKFCELVRQSNTGKPQNISLYIHIPFCPALCLYCGCNTHITNDENLKESYFDTLKKEIMMLRPLLDKNRKISQVHWGGGTPNSVKINKIAEIMQLIFHEFDFISEPEIAMECNPSLLDFEYLDRLIDLGFNRISLGVQDFSEKVLNEVHRAIPKIHVSEFVNRIHSSGKAKVNLDFIYGLPHQSINSFADTINRALLLQPDRLVTFSYAHIPNIKKAQLALEKAGIAGPDEKVKMYENTYRIMLAAGYTPVGMDHFARPTDDLSMAAASKTLHRNFQGYCTLETTGQVYALGTTGISQLENGYAQNAKTLKQYMQLIDAGLFTTEKGYILSDSEKAIRHVISEIMCNLHLSWSKAATDLQTTVDELKNTVKYSVAELQNFADENLLNFTENELNITETGRFFIRNIAASFDPNLNYEGKTFSKAL